MEGIGKCFKNGRRITEGINTLAAMTSFETGAETAFQRAELLNIPRLLDLPDLFGQTLWASFDPALPD